MYGFQHSSSRVDSTFGWEIREPSAEAPFSKEKARLPTDSCCTTQAFTPGQLHLDHSRLSNRSPRLVYNHSMVLKKRLLSLCHLPASLGSDWALLFLLLPLLCSSNLSTVPWFHSVCASVSMFTINTVSVSVSASVSVSCRTILIRFRVDQTHVLNFVQTFQDVIRWDLGH